MCPIILAILSIGIPVSKVNVPKLFFATCRVSGIRMPQTKPMVLRWATSCFCSLCRKILCAHCCSLSLSSREQESVPSSNAGGSGVPRLFSILSYGYIVSHHYSFRFAKFEGFVSRQKPIL